MVRTAFGYTITALVVFIFLSLSGCKKLDKDNPVKVYIKAHVPYDNTPIPHVKYIIREYKSKQSGGLGEVEYTDFELSGNTDANGIVDISFFRKKNQKYYYDIQFDYSNISVPFQEYTLINAPMYAKVQKSEPNSFEIRVLPRCQMHYKVENVNCFDSSDSMRFKVFNYDERPFESFDLIPIWSNYRIGCGVFSDLNYDNIMGGRHLYQIEVTRNGIVNTYIDTFLLLPNQVNDVFIEY